MRAQEPHLDATLGSRGNPTIFLAPVVPGAWEKELPPFVSVGGMGGGQRFCEESKGVEVLLLQKYLLIDERVGRWVNECVGVMDRRWMDG